MVRCVEDVNFSVPIQAIVHPEHFAFVCLGATQDFASKTGRQPSGSSVCYHCRVVVDICSLLQSAQSCWDAFLFQAGDRPT